VKTHESDEGDAVAPPLPQTGSRKRRRNAIRPGSREARMIEQVAWKFHAQVRGATAQGLDWCVCLYGVRIGGSK
jgi:hypothetical protein